MADVPTLRPAHLLACDERQKAVLVETAPGGTLRLPVLGMLGESESPQPIAALVAGFLGEAHPILRILECGEHATGEATDVLVIVEPVATSMAASIAAPGPGGGPGGAGWVPAGDPRLTALRDGPAIGPGIRRWLDELVTGVVDPRRQRWEHPGFEARARSWMLRQLELAGTPAVAEPTLTQLWTLSAMLRAETSNGAVFLKACARVFDIEPATTLALHHAVPGTVPAVIATDLAEGWLLMRDAGGTFVGEQPLEVWQASLGALAAIQQATTGGLDGIALEDRGPAALAAALPALLDNEYVATFPEDIGPRFRAAAPRLADACAALASLGPGPTVIHGDFHPGNVFRDGDRVVVIDWSDAALGHPFTDLATWLNRLDRSWPPAGRCSTHGSTAGPTLPRGPSSRRQRASPWWSARCTRSRATGGSSPRSSPARTRCSRGPGRRSRGGRSRGWTTDLPPRCRAAPESTAGRGASDSNCGRASVTARRNATFAARSCGARSGLMRWRLTRP